MRYLSKSFSNYPKPNIECCEKCKQESTVYYIKEEKQYCPKCYKEISNG